jgi:hypothetical protein
MAHHGTLHRAQELVGEMGECHRSGGRRLDPHFRRRPLNGVGLCHLLWCIEIPPRRAQEVMGEMGEQQLCGGVRQAPVASHRPAMMHKGRCATVMGFCYILHMPSHHRLTTRIQCLEAMPQIRRSTHSNCNCEF